MTIDERIYAVSSPRTKCSAAVAVGTYITMAKDEVLLVAAPDAR